MTLSPDRSLPKSNTGSEGTSGSGTVRVNPGCDLQPECEDVVHSSITNCHILYLTALSLSLSIDFRPDP